MISKELEHATIQERQREVDRLRLERQAEAAASVGRTEVLFLTSAARVLATVVREPGVTIRDVALRCDKTERAVWQQLRELERVGLLRRRREGRRNRYEVDLSAVQKQVMSEGAPLLLGAAS